MLNRTTHKFVQSLIAGVAILGATSAVHAEVIASYDSGVTAAIGVGGAADPTTQGWTYAGANNFGTHAHAADGGWRIADASTGAGSALLYVHTFTPLESQALTAAPGWTLSATVMLDSGFIPNPDVYAQAPTPGYYLPPNHGQQENTAFEVSVANEYRYIIKIQADENGDLVVDDWTTKHKITNTGGNVAYDTFYDVVLEYDAGAATVTVAGQSIAVSAVATSATLNRALFGAGQSSTMGSAVYNNVTLTAVPEPGSLALLAAGGVMMIRRRRRA